MFPTALIGTSQCAHDTQRLLPTALFRLVNVPQSGPAVPLHGYLTLPCTVQTGTAQTCTQEQCSAASTLALGPNKPTWLANCPTLPIACHDALRQPALKESFMMRAVAHADWEHLQPAEHGWHGLTRYHARYKYQLMAVSPHAYRQLGRLLASSRDTSVQRFAPDYFRQLMAAFETPATRGGHRNALEHIAGYLKRVLSSDEKHTLQTVIERYHVGAVPLSDPVALLHAHFQRHPDEYILQQVYIQLHRHTA